MRTFLIFIAWASLAGSLFDGAILAWLGWLVAGGEAPLDISVDAHLRDHLPWLYWVKDIAFAVLPDGLARFVFELEAMIYFPVRIVMSIVIGWACFALARRL